jgi:hypothetical protein
LLYLDIVKIPPNSDIKEYFNIGITCPSDWGDVQDFDSRLFFESPDQSIQFELRFKKFKLNPDSTETKYSFLWYCQKTNIHLTDISQLEKNMQQVRDYMRTRFDIIFTEKCKQIFVPIKEN